MKMKVVAQLISDGLPTSFEWHESFIPLVGDYFTPDGEVSEYQVVKRSWNIDDQTLYLICKDELRC
jgi:hypothetical protein